MAAEQRIVANSPWRKYRAVRDHLLDMLSRPDRKLNECTVCHWFEYVDPQAEDVAADDRDDCNDWDLCVECGEPICHDCLEAARGAGTVGYDPASANRHQPVVCGDCAERQCRR